MGQLNRIWPRACTHAQLLLRRFGQPAICWRVWLLIFVGPVTLLCSADGAFAQAGDGADSVAPTDTGGSAAAPVADEEAQRLGAELAHRAATIPLPEAADLIRRGADVNAIDMEGWTALSRASKAGRVYLLEMLLGAGADPLRAIDPYNLGRSTPLHWAAYSGSTEAVELLVASGVPVDLRDGYNATALIGSSDDAAMIEKLVELGADINARDVMGYSCLHYCVLYTGEDNRSSSADETQGTEVARLLVGLGADINSGNTETETPLHLAAINGYVPMLKALLELGADVNSTNGHGNTPLHYCGKYGTRESAELLRQHGARIDDIYAAATVNDAERAAELIEIGVNIDVVDWQGETPLQWAVRMGSIDVAVLMIERGAGLSQHELNRALIDACREDQARMVNALLGAGADPAVEGPDGSTALHAAAAGRQLEVIELLLRWGAPPDVPDARGRTAMHIAAWRNFSDVLELLAAGGGSVEALDEESRRPLHYAADGPGVDAITLLIALGANPAPTNSRGATPLHELATESYNNFSEAAAYINAAMLLIEAGAEVNFEDQRGFRPLDYAMPSKTMTSGQNAAFIEFLREQGAENSPAWEANPTGLHTEPYM